MASKNIYFNDEIFLNLDLESNKKSKAFSSVVCDRINFSFVFNDIYSLYMQLLLTDDSSGVCQTLKKLVIDRIENKESVI